MAQKTFSIWNKGVFKSLHMMVTSLRNRKVQNKPLLCHMTHLVDIEITVNSPDLNLNTTKCFDCKLALSDRLNTVKPFPSPLIPVCNKFAWPISGENYKLFSNLPKRAPNPIKATLRLLQVDINCYFFLI